PGANGDPLATHLDLDMGFGGEVVEPPRVLRRATLRGDHHVRLRFAHVEQRGGAGRTSTTPDRAQQQHRPAAEARTDPSIRALVEPLVDGEQRTHDAFEERVHAGAHSRRRALAHTGGALVAGNPRAPSRTATRSRWY